MGNDGVVHIIADEGVMHKTLAGIDFSRAQLLSNVSTFWSTRSRFVFQRNTPEKICKSQTAPVYVPAAGIMSSFCKA